MIIKGCSIAELETYFQELGESAYRGRQAFARINRLLAGDIEEFTEFSKDLRQLLSEKRALPAINLVKLQESKDGTSKALFEIGSDKSDGEKKLIETVWIPSGQRRTICVSAQCGCSLDCSFCATGQIKFRGNLPAWQIVDQAYELARRYEANPTNIVFMGMGEPFYNYDNVIKAARILHHPMGLNIAAQKITISTAGVLPGIERFMREKEPFSLALSLNHTDEERRSELMPINERYPLSRVIPALRKYAQEMKRTVTLEYIMIPGYNMSGRDLRGLIKLCHSLNSRLNLIPLNTEFGDYRTPTEDEMVNFSEQLHRAGVRVFNRGSPGRDIAAACGMLALKQS